MTRYWTLILLFGWSAVALAAQDFERPTRLAVSVQPAADAEESTFAGIIRNAAALELRVAGFAIVADQAEADYVLAAEYRETGDSLTAAFTANEGRGGEVGAQGRWSGPASLSMDQDIQQVVRRDIVPSLPLSRPASRRDTEQAAERGESWAEEALAGERVAAAGSPERDAPDAPWHLSARGAVYLPLTETATFAALGYGGHVNFGYRFDIGAFDLDADLSLGAMIYDAEAKYAAKLLFVPLGAVARISAGTGILRPNLSLAGGAAWFLFRKEGESPQSKIVPYGEAGLGIEVQIHPSIVLGADAAFRLIFEGSVVLTHIAPALGVGVSF